MPCIAATWTFLILSSRLFEMNYEYKDLLVKTKGKGKELFGLLGELHGVISGFKGVSTWYAEKFSE